MKNTQKNSLSQLKLLRGNIRLALGVMGISVAAIAAILFITLNTQTRFENGRTQLLSINNFIVRLTEIQRTGSSEVELLNLAEDMQAFHDRYISRIAGNPGELINPGAEVLRGTLRQWATSINDLNNRRNQLNLVLTLGILTGIFAMLVLLAFRLYAGYRVHSSFFKGLDAMLRSIHSELTKENSLPTSSFTSHELTNASPQPQRNSDIQRWSESRDLMNMIDSIKNELKLSERLLEIGYDFENLDALIIHLHALITKSIPCDRLALAFLDTAGNVTLESLHSTSDQIFLDAGYSEHLSESSLKNICETFEPRIINDLTKSNAECQSETTELIIQEGFYSSITLPLVFNQRCVGFVFINARQRDAYQLAHIAKATRYFNILKNYVYHHYMVQLIFAETASAFVKAMEKKDDDTSMHIIRMSQYSYILSRRLLQALKNDEVPGDIRDDYEIDDRKSREILWFAPLHDLGKIGIPDRILFKTGGFNQEERAVMESHVPMGSSILTTLNNNLSSYLHTRFLDTAVRIIDGHHEHWNGEGYPRGISGVAIPLEARIVSIADVFDALTNDRPYKKAWPVEKALDFIRSERDRHFDPYLVDLFLSCRREIDDICDKYQEA